MNKFTLYTAWICVLSFMAFVGVAVIQSFMGSLTAVPFIVTEAILLALFIASAIIVKIGDK